ncbi:MAG: hypothetical protein HY814_14220 [Candidatus Riflebacteria bacterium]|nr:hypothetical protein [Candidatus Riflebacteria bacterium]
MKLRRATFEDRETLLAVAAETPGLPPTADYLEWPTCECFVVEDDEGEVLGFGYLEAIPEAHFVLRRRKVSQEKKRHAIELLHIGAQKVAVELKLPAIRYPVRGDVPKLAIWISALSNVQGDPRVHLTLVAPRGET